jgi:hypothetical protein
LTCTELGLVCLLLFMAAVLGSELVNPVGLLYVLEGRG